MATHMPLKKKFLSPLHEISIRPPTNIQNKNPFCPPFDLDIVDLQKMIYLKVKDNEILNVDTNLSVQSNTEEDGGNHKLEISSRKNGMEVLRISYKSGKYYLRFPAPMATISLFGDKEKLTITIKVTDPSTFWECLGVT